MRSQSRASMLAMVSLAISSVVSPLLFAQEPAQREEIRVRPGPLATHEFSFFTMSVPSSADIHPVPPIYRVPSPLLSVSVSDSLSSANVFIAVFRLPKAMTIRQWARRAFLADSVESARSDWGVPEPVEYARLGGAPAWRFGPTCGDCYSWTLFAAKGDTAVSVHYIFDDRLTASEVKVLRAYYARMFATFRWRGA